MTTIVLEMCNPRQANEALNDLYKNTIKPYTRKGARGRIKWETENPWRREGQRNYFHGPVCRHIAMHVWMWDAKREQLVRYAPLVWKEHFRELFLDPIVEEYTVKSTGEVKWRTRKRSTESLSDDEFAEFLMQVEAYCQDDLDCPLPDPQSDRGRT